jgi:tetratricopeptide (TPR) repeat protein
VTLLQEGIEKDIAELGAEVQLLMKNYQLGVIYSYYLGEQEMAIEWFVRADSINHVGGMPSPFWSTALNGARARSLARLGQFDAAHALLDSCRATIMDNDQRLLNVYSGSLGRVLREEGKYDSAVLLAEAEADGVDWRNQFRIYRTLGVTYVAAGRYDDAIPTLEKALSRYDNNRFSFPDRSVTAHYFLGQAYEGAGRTRDAIEQYETFLDIWKNADEGLVSVEDAKARLARLTS